jgi:hypothetical protein
VFSQSTLASRPIYRAPGSAIGTRYGGLEFDGTDDYLNRTVANWLSTSSSGLIVAVVKKDGTGVDRILSSANENTTSHYLSLSSQDDLKLQQRDADTASTVSTANSTLGTSAAIIAINSDGSTWTCFINGSASALAEDEGSNNGDWFADTGDAVDTRDNVTIGSMLWSSGSNNPFDGIISELLVYDGTVTDAQRTAIFRQLALDYGISI